jgi:ribosomal protein L11 methylase PrmA
LAAGIRGSKNFLKLIRQIPCVKNGLWKTAGKNSTPTDRKSITLLNSSPEGEWNSLIRNSSFEFQRLCSEYHDRSTAFSERLCQHCYAQEPELRFRTAGTEDIDENACEEAVRITRSFMVTRSREFLSSSTITGHDNRGKTGQPCLSVFIQSGWAFGTGSHPSTMCSIMALERLNTRGFLKHGTSVLDMGTGTGILAIAAALMGAGNVVAVDIDAEALLYARQNAEENHVEERIQVISYEQWKRTSHVDEFDICLANLTLSVASLLMPEMETALRGNGFIMLSGFKEGASDTVRDILARHNLSEKYRFSRSGWRAVLARGIQS